MISAFTSWIKYIIFVVMFATFLELLLPNSSMQRFVRVIMGLFIMLAILNPIIDVVQNHLSPNQVPAFSDSSANSAIILSNINNVAQDREQLSTEIYKKELAQQMKVMIVAMDGVADAKVVIETNNIKNSKLPSVVKNVVVYVKPGIPANHSKIEKVSIGQQNDQKEELNVEVKNKIKSTIAEIYQLPKEIVVIKFLHT